MNPINKSMFLYLVTAFNLPENYIAVDCLHGAVISAPSPGMAILIMKNIDASSNNNLKDFWHKYGKVEKIGIVPENLNQKSKAILKYWR